MVELRSHRAGVVAIDLRPRFGLDGVVGARTTSTVLMSPQGNAHAGLVARLLGWIDQAVQHFYCQGIRRGGYIDVGHVRPCLQVEHVPRAFSESDSTTGTLIGADNVCLCWNQNQRCYSPHHDFVCDVRQIPNLMGLEPQFKNGSGGAVAIQVHTKSGDAHFRPSIQTAMSNSRRSEGTGPSSSPARSLLRSSRNRRLSAAAKSECMARTRAGQAAMPRTPVTGRYLSTIARSNRGTSLGRLRWATLERMDSHFPSASPESPAR